MIKQRIILKKIYAGTLQVFIVVLLISCVATVQAQQPPAALRKGNELYKKNDFENARKEYEKAIAQNPKNAPAHYNAGNTSYRLNNFTDAITSYETTIENSKEKETRQKAFYNKGVALSKEQKLEESIAAWKEALKLNPNDNEARENLQKALLEQKKQQEEKEKEKDKQKEKQQQKEKPKPEQQQSKLNKQQVEQLLKAMQQKEKEIQQKLQKGSPAPSKPEKDW
jgi:Ca-activated chloride channel homolog